MKAEKVIEYQTANMENTEVACAKYKIAKNTYKTKIEFEKNNFEQKKKK